MDKNKGILVTGANGFVGSHVLRALIDEGFTNIHGLIRSSSNLDQVKDIQQNIQWQIGNIQDIFSLETAMKSIDYVIHSAAIVSYNPKREAEIYKTNELGTANVVNVASTMGIKKVVHISSIAALGRKKDDLQVNEGAIWTNSNYNTAYAKSKYLAEQQAWRAFYEGLPITILNPSVILGIGDWNSSSLQFLSKLKKGSLFYPLGSTGFVDVEDVARFAVKSIDEKYTGNRYILNNVNVKYIDFFNLITKKLNAPSPKIPLSPIWRSIGWRLESLRSLLFGTEPLLTKETAKSSSLMVEYDNTKSQSQFNITYKPFNQTIDEMITAYKSSQ